MINQVRLSSNASLTLFTRFQIHPLHTNLMLLIIIALQISSAYEGLGRYGPAISMAKLDVYV